MRDGDYQLSNQGLHYPDSQGQQQIVAYKAIKVMELRLLPGRFSADHYACEISTDADQVTLMSRHLNDYAAFVRALHVQAASHNPSIQFGRPLSVVRKVFHTSFHVLLIIAMTALLYGLWTASTAPIWVNIIFTMITMAYISLVLRWFGQHWSGRYDPFNLPPQLLPR
ncbi:hypothetical protein [Pseudidiomarina mangrovi]|uniref:hypothetical protein n=1 Tax=Pseudidiomarina mangrovi TaxID=2487133 RepID=UPI000FCCA81B|nr:hypothetical protein [Pseudidiomarina mangrovi]